MDSTTTWRRIDSAARDLIRRRRLLEEDLDARADSCEEALGACDAWSIVFGRRSSVKCARSVRGATREGLQLLF